MRRVNQEFVIPIDQIDLVQEKNKNSGIVSESKVPVNGDPE